MPSPAAHEDTIHVTAAQARRLALVEAIDAADGEARLVGRLEREQLERDALAATGDPAAGEQLDAKAYLLERAARLLALVSHRQPAVARLQEPPAWHAWAAWVLPALAFLAGAAIERIDNPRQVNLLSPPLLAFLFWNFAVYLLLAVRALRRAPARAEPRAWASWPILGASHGNGQWRSQVEPRFRLAWWRLAGPVASLRWLSILHASAAAWAIGVALSIVLGGLVREYRIGWESTLLDLPQVHAFLRALFWPVVALTPLEPFSLAELERLHFRSGQEVARQEARRWIFMYLALLALVVMLPRALLAAVCRWRHRAGMRSVAIDLTAAYYTPLLGRVRPARVLLWVLGGTGAPLALEQALRQASGARPPADLRDPWAVLQSGRGDVLLCRGGDLPGAGAPAVPQPAAWWRRAPRAAVHAPAADRPDILVVALEGDAESFASQLAHLPDLPVLAMPAQAGEADVQAALRRAGRSGAVLPLSALPTWREDARLRSAIARLLPPWKAPGMERLSAAWSAHAQSRLQAAMRLLAGELLLAARDTLALPGAPVGVRQLVVREDRQAQQDARRDAAQALLARWRERQAAGDAHLLALHALNGVLPATGWQPRLPNALQVQQAVHEPQAGLAGAASGAAMGAAVDLMTGGLTLGAAAALGALVGGGAALAGAAWKNRGTEAGVASMAATDGMLLSLAGGALVRYLAVAHEGRAAADVQRWEAAAAAALEPEAETLRELWAQAREGAAEPAPEARLAQCLERAALRALEALNGEPA